MWAGNQLLWELRAPGQLATGIDLEATTGSGDWYGRVSYFHAGGIDKPLLITKAGVGSLVPRDTWRGLFHAGTSPATGMRGDCTGASPTGCIWAPWPGWQTTASHAQTGTAPEVQAWFGGLVDGMRDASGQMYMRNRYYDPATGQFTQTDPIGLAGGLNTYGFAAGDPVSYSDPYGLAPSDTSFASFRARAAVLHAMASSPTLRKEVARYAKNPNLHIHFDTATSQFVAGGSVSRPFTNGLGQTQMNVTFDFGDIATLMRDPRVRKEGGVTEDDIVGHEIHAHVEGFLRNPIKGCPDEFYGVKSCSVPRENEIRRELGHADRTF